MVIIRLGEFLRLSEDSDFTFEDGQLSFDAGWTLAEREFRLCSGLRHVVSETSRIRASALNHISMQDWDDMQQKIQAVFYGEAQLGDFIASKFHSLSDIEIGKDKTVQEIRNKLIEFQ